MRRQISGNIQRIEKTLTQLELFMPFGTFKERRLAELISNILQEIKVVYSYQQYTLGAVVAARTQSKPTPEQLKSLEEFERYRPIMKWQARAIDDEAKNVESADK